MKNFLAFLLAIIVLGGVAFFSVGSGFFTFNLIMQNKEQADEDVAQSVASYNAGTYYDLDITYESDSSTYEANIQIDTVNEEFAVTLSNDESDYELYYTDNKTYTYKKSDNSKVYTFDYDFDDALEFLLPDYHMFYLSDLDIENIAENSTVTTSFAYSFIPFYIGLSYTYAINESEEVLTFTYDAARTLRMFEHSTDTYSLQFKMNSYSKVLELSLPTFDEYVPAI